MISQLLFLVSIVDAPVVSHKGSPQRADTLCQHQRRGTMQSSTSALYCPSQDFLDGFRSHGIKRNTHTSWKRVRVLPQTNMLEAVLSAKAFICGADSVCQYASHKTSTHMFILLQPAMLPVAVYRVRVTQSICRKVCFSWMFAVPYKAHSRHGATSNPQPGNFPQSSCVLPSFQISTLDRSRSRPYSPLPPPSSTVDVRHLLLSL